MNEAPGTVVMDAGEGESITWRAIPAREPLRLVRVGRVHLVGMSVPVWRIDDPLYYSGPLVREQDLPADLARAFARWQVAAACPAQGSAYLHDFVGFLHSGGRRSGGAIRDMLQRYLVPRP